MHFFYLDESGCTGANLADADQPIFVMGGLSVRDEGWNQTQERFNQIISGYFRGNAPPNFELHAHDLLSPKGNGVFRGDPVEARCQLVRDVLALIEERHHDVHMFAIDKTRMAASECTAPIAFNSQVPYLCAFDYLITFINDHVKYKLGKSARAMVILDNKEQFHSEVESITHARRYQGAPSTRVKWIVEFTHPVDSRKNPMVQISDLIVLCARRFLELDGGYRDSWPQDVKRFYVECYEILDKRMNRQGLVSRPGKGLQGLDTYLEAVRATPRRGWKARYGA